MPPSSDYYAEMRRALLSDRRRECHKAEALQLAEDLENRLLVMDENGVDELPLWYGTWGDVTTRAETERALDAVLKRPALRGFIPRRRMEVLVHQALEQSAIPVEFVPEEEEA